MILTGVSLLVLALDQTTKFLILHSIPLGQSRVIFPNYLYFTFTQNSGIAFGFMSNMDAAVRVPFFTAITIAAAFMVYYCQRLIPEEDLAARVALGLIWGGALGNLVDRLLYGKVVDFIDARYADFQWYIFNAADSFITIGLAYLFFEFVLKNVQKKTL